MRSTTYSANYFSLILALILFVLAVFFSASHSYSQGMRYLPAGELSQYDDLLKKQGHPELTTIFAVYDDSFNPPRAGLKCLNKKNQRFEVYITDNKIVRINKLPGKGKW